MSYLSDLYQSIVEEISHNKYGVDFRELPDTIQIEVYNEALEEARSRILSMA